MATESEIDRYFEKAGAVFAGFVEAITADGKLGNAAARGADELSRALVALPDSVQSQMPSNLWGPGEGNTEPMPSPGEIARSDMAMPPDASMGMEQSQNRGMGL